MKLVILDRDGTINEDRDDYVKSAEEWVPLPGALEAIARLHQAGWHVAVATNQSGLGRGLFDMAALTAMHSRMAAGLAQAGGRVDAVFFCPHVPEDGCECRKPKPGLFLDIGLRYGMNLAGVPAVGDSLRDLQAAHTAGCEPHLVRTGKAAMHSDAQIEDWLQQVPGALLHADLPAFADFLIRRERAAKGLADEPDSGHAPLSAHGALG